MTNKNDYSINRITKPIFRHFGRFERNDYISIEYSIEYLKHHNRAKRHIPTTTYRKHS